MTPLEIWGWACGIFGASTGLPQVIRIVRARTSAGLSLLSWQLNLGAIMAWAAHGILVARPNLIGPNLFLVVCYTVILTLIVRDRALPVAATVAPVLGLFGVLAAVDVLAGSFWFGVVVVIPGIFAALAQLKDLIERPDLSGVSVTWLWMLVMLNLMWFSWSVFSGEIAIFVVASVMGVLSITNVVTFLLRRTGVLRGAESG